MVGMVISGTGHRPDKLGGYKAWENEIEPKLVIKLISILEKYPPKKIISGMAQGWDTVLARAACATSIPLELHLPCKNQAARWPKNAQRVHAEICEKADNVIYVSENYTRSCMQLRNVHMVENSDIILALWNGTKGGTGNCINYAKKQNKPILNLWDTLMEEKQELPSFVDPNINLREEDHVYLLNGEEQGFTSVTTLIHYLFPPFVPEKIAQNLLQYPKYKGRTVKDILEEWEESNKVGTLVHWELEQYAISRREPTHERAMHGCKWLDRIIDRGIYRLYPEVILYNTDLKVCGTGDLILEEISTGHLHVMDYKCIRKLRFKSFDNEYGIHPITAHLMNCNYIVYSIQLSIYRYMLEQFHNRIVHTQNLIHIREHDVKVYRCRYYKQIVEQMFALLPDGIPNKKGH